MPAIRKKLTQRHSFNMTTFVELATLEVSLPFYSAIHLAELPTSGGR